MLFRFMCKLHRPRCRVFSVRNGVKDLDKLCSNCGAVIHSEALFCEKCGMKIEKAAFCRKCGENMGICPACGALLDQETKSKNLRDRAGAVLAGKNSRKFRFGAILLIVVATVCVFLLINSRPSFQRAFEDAGGANSIGEWVTVSKDGKSMKIDTNPADEEGYYSSKATNAIRDINESLGLPDALYDKMGETRAIDGRQTATYKNISVSWTYHPDDGLEIIYERT